MLKMRLPGTAEYQVIIKEYNDTFANKRAEDIIHQRHKRGWRIGEAESHNLELILAERRVNRRFRNIPFSYSNLMIARHKVKF